MKYFYNYFEPLFSCFCLFIYLFIYSFLFIYFKIWMIYVLSRSYVMYSCGPLHLDEQRQDDQLEPTHSSSVPIRNVAVKIWRKQWTTGSGGERGSEISVLMARHDDDFYITDQSALTRSFKNFIEISQTTIFDLQRKKLKDENPK